MNELLIGRVLKMNGLSGEAEFVPQARVGDFLYYTNSDNKRVTCQITLLRNAPTKGMHGRFRLLDVDSALPKTWTELFMLHNSLDTGLIEIGKDDHGNTIRLQVNPFFLHTVLAGMTQQGKTHTLLVLHEEFLKLKVPALILDTQGEFVHLDQFSENAIVTRKLDLHSLIEHLKKRRTVVYNLQGLPRAVKADVACSLLMELYYHKEQEYRRAESNAGLLETPPLIVSVDEAEIYAPSYKRAPAADCPDGLLSEFKATLVDIAKRGSKYGIGLLVATQRISQLDRELASQCSSGFLFHVTDDENRVLMRRLRYVTQLELGKIRDFTRGQCLLAGQLVSHPVTAFIRDIATPRAKNVDFESALDLEKPPERTPEPMPPMGELTAPNPVKKTMSCIACPDCGKPMVFSHNTLRCENEECAVLEIKRGEAKRATVPIPNQQLGGS